MGRGGEGGNRGRRNAANKGEREWITRSDLIVSLASQFMKRIIE